MSCVSAKTQRVLARRGNDLRIDWAMWSIAVARDNRDFQALLEPIFRYADETASRVPLSDWFVTTCSVSKPPEG